MDIGIVAGVSGGVIGVLGGAVGTYFSIKNTCGPKERAFMMQAAAVCWLGVALFLGLMLLLPKPCRFLLWIPYAIVLPLAIVYGNRTQQRIRREESGHA